MEDKFSENLAALESKGFQSNEKERAAKDIEKLDRIIEVAKKFGFDKKYPEVFEFVLNYAHDAKHYFEKEEYFTSFGAANYAYGFIDCLLILEKKKDETNVF
jgi:hypothetical protein